MRFSSKKIELSTDYEIRVKVIIIFTLIGAIFGAIFGVLGLQYQFLNLMINESTSMDVILGIFTFFAFILCGFLIPFVWFGIRFWFSVVFGTSYGFAGCLSLIVLFLPHIFIPIFTIFFAFKGLIAIIKQDFHTLSYYVNYNKYNASDISPKETHEMTSEERADYEAWKARYDPTL